MLPSYILNDSIKYLRNLREKLPPRKPRKLSVNVRKTEAVCVKELCGNSVFLLIAVVKGSAPVLVISQYRMVFEGKLRPDLMGAPGDQMHLQKGKLLAICYRFILCLNRDKAGSRCRDLFLPAR